MSFPLQNHSSPGTRAAAYQSENHIWTRFDSGVVDGREESSPPDIAKLDRRVETYADFGFDWAFSDRYGSRLHLSTEYSKRRKSEEEGPRSNVDETIQTHRAELDLTFITDKGLEIFGGIAVNHVPPYDQTIDMDAGTSKTSYGSAQVRTKRVGVVRRAGAWTGGFYYVIGAESSQEFSKEAFDGSSIDGEETVFEPGEVSVFGLFGAAEIVWDFELAFVQARGLGPRDESGNSVYTDHFRARWGAQFDLGELAMKSSIMHRTLSYANSAFVSFDTMPFTSLDTRAIFGTDESHFFTGLILGYGTDGQSLPEFNAEYKMQAMAVSVGLFRGI